MIRPWIRPRLAQSSTSAVSSYESRDESRSVSPVEVLELVRQTKRPESYKSTNLLTDCSQIRTVARSRRYSPFFSSSGPRRATRDDRDLC